MRNRLLPNLLAQRCVLASTFERGEPTIFRVQWGYT
jgi:hypothetical protein